MKNTSIALGEHFSHFIAEQIASGRYQSASEVVRAGLQRLEDDEHKLQALREDILQAQVQAQAGQFVAYDPQVFLEEALAKYDK